MAPRAIAYTVIASLWVAVCCVVQVTASALAELTEAEETSVSLQDVLSELRSLREEQAELRAQLAKRCACCEACGGGHTNDGNSSEQPLEEYAVVQGGFEEDTVGLVRVDVQNTEWMKEVLFGGEPWILHCLDSGGPLSVMAPDVLVEAAKDFRSLATFGVVDCWRRMQSGTTLAHRFDFPRPPVTVAVANGDPPVVMDLHGVAKPWQLKRKAAPHLTASIEKIDGPQRFKQFCSSRRACLVVGFKTTQAFAGAVKTLTPLLERHRSIRAVAVDTTVWKVKLDPRLAATKPKKSGGGAAGAGSDHRAELLCFARQRGGASRGGAFFKASSGDLSEQVDAVEQFLGRCSEARSLIGVEKAPQISTRPPETPKYRSPSTASRSTGATSSASSQKSSSFSRKGKNGDASSGATGSTGGKARAGSFGAAGRRAHGGKGSRADVVGSRKQLEEDDEPTFVALDEEERLAEEGSTAEEDGDDDVEEVEL